MTLNPSIVLPILFWNVKQKINKLQIIHVRWTCLLSLGLTQGFQRVISCVYSGLIERSGKLLYMKIKQSSLFDLTFLERFVAFRRPLLSGMTDSSRISRGSSILLFHSSPQPSNATLIASLSLQTTVQTHQTPSSSRASALLPSTNLFTSLSIVALYNFTSKTGFVRSRKSHSVAKIPGRSESHAVIRKRHCACVNQFLHT